MGEMKQYLTHRFRGVPDGTLRPTWTIRFDSAPVRYLPTVKRSLANGGWPQRSSDESLIVPALKPEHSSSEAKSKGLAAWLLGPVTSTAGEWTVAGHAHT